MKGFIIGLVIGIVVGGTGGYAILKESVDKYATKENAEKVSNATKTFATELGSIVK